MKFTRFAARSAGAAFAVAVSSSHLFAQAYPSRPITLILPFGVGTASDVTTRLIVDTVEKATGAKLTIENRVGALGTIGSRAVATAPKDGYTILMTSISSHSLGGSFTKDLPYDPVKDFTHIAAMTYNPATVLVRDESPFKTIKGLVDHVKANAGKLNYAYASGSTWVMGARFHKVFGLNSVAVPYKSSQESLVDLLGGRIDYMISDALTATTAAQGGKGRVLMILSDDKLPTLPGVPSMKDEGYPSIGLKVWTGIAGPAGMSDDARQWLVKNFSAALNDSAVRQKVQNLSAEIADQSLDTTKFVSEQLKLWGDAAADAGVKAE